jgi:WD40 repeat protein
VQIRQGVRDLDTVVMQRGVAREWIEVLKYSPNGQFLAVGSHDNKIYILAVAQNYQTVATLAKHNSFITSLDWSTDSLHIQSNCGAYELLFYDATNGN